MTPMVNTIKIAIPLHIPLHLSYRGQLIGRVAHCTNPGVYTVTNIVPKSSRNPIADYYVRTYPHPRTYRGELYDTWIVNAEDVEPHV